MTGTVFFLPLILGVSDQGKSSHDMAGERMETARWFIEIGAAAIEAMVFGYPPCDPHRAPGAYVYQMESWPQLFLDPDLPELAFGSRDGRPPAVAAKGSYRPRSDGLRGER